MNLLTRKQNVQNNPEKTLSSALGHYDVHCRCGPMGRSSLGRYRPERVCRSPPGPPRATAVSRPVNGRRPERRNLAVPRQLRQRALGPPRCVDCRLVEIARPMVANGRERRPGPETAWSCWRCVGSVGSRPGCRGASPVSAVVARLCSSR